MKAASQTKTMQPTTVIDHTPIYHRYKGQWVVLSRSRKQVLASGKTLSEALIAFRLHSKGQPPSVLKLPTELTPYVGSTA